MKTIHTDVFLFDELDDNAKEKARAWWRDASADDSFWSECVLDDAKECLKFAGWTIDKIYFSGFWSQGDGACFEGSWYAQNVNPQAMRGHAPQDAELQRIAADLTDIAKDFPHASGSVKHRGHYYHEMCTVFSFDLGDDDTEAVQNLVYRSPEDIAHSEQVAATETAWIETSRDAMRWIYRQLERAYDWENADEQVDANIRANEYTFTKAGKRFG